MAYYKVDQTILDQGEYDNHIDELWGGFLFLIGAIAAGILIHKGMPEEWPKELRFIAIIGGGYGIGFLMGLLAPIVRIIVMVSLGLGIVGGLGYLLWSVI